MLSFFPRGVLDEIWNLTGSVSEDFPSYSITFSHFVQIPTYGIREWRLNETGWKPELLIFSSLGNIPSSYGLCLGEVDVVRRWPKEIKSQTRTILETIHPLYSV